LRAFPSTYGRLGLARRKRASGRIVNTYQLQTLEFSRAGTHGKRAVNFTYQALAASPSFSMDRGDSSNWDTFGQDFRRVQIASGDPNLDFREKRYLAYLARL